MLRVHKYQDDKNSKTRRLAVDREEIWNQDGAKGEYKHKFNSLALLLGFDLQRNSTDEQRFNAKTRALQQDYKTNEEINALYSEIKFNPLDKLTFTLNGRYDNIQHKYKDKNEPTQNVTPNYNVFSYRLGANYKLNKEHRVYSSVSTGFRTPTVQQMSRNSVELTKNPSLDIPSEINLEKSRNYELGAQGALNNFTYNASIYQLDRKNYIGMIAGNYITSDDPEESNFDNVGDMRSRGFELALMSPKQKELSFSLAYTYLDARFTQYMLSRQMTLNTNPVWRPSNAEFQRVDLSGNYVPRTSKHTLNFTLYYKPIKKLLITTELFLKGSYWADEINQNKESGYEVINMRAKYEIAEGLEIFGRIDNILNKNYYQFVNINSSAIATMEDDATIRVAPPRNFYAGLRYKF